jgi:hypothetical protein
MLPKLFKKLELENLVTLQHKLARVGTSHRTKKSAPKSNKEKRARIEQRKARQNRTKKRAPKSNKKSAPKSNKEKRARIKFL